MRIRILDSAVPLAVLLAGASAQSHPNPRPAFLDAFDEIRVALPYVSDLGDLHGKVSVALNGNPLVVAGVEGGEVGTDPVPADFINLPGSLQAALGEPAWNPAGRSTALVRRADGLYELTIRLPKGRYEYKIALGGTWDHNFGRGFKEAGDNFVLELDRDQIVRFVVDMNSHEIRNSVDNPERVKAPVTIPTRMIRTGRFQSIRIKLARPLSAEQVGQKVTVSLGDGDEHRVFARNVLGASAFQYSGDDLGNTWSPRQTKFRVWSPIASTVSVVLYRSATGAASKEYPMHRSQAGTWVADIPGDLHGAYYQYRFESYGEVRFAADIYGRAASRDSSRSMVANLAVTDPPGWPAPRVFAGKHPTDAVLYEAHVRDFTVAPSSGVKPEWRGKYLGVVQSRTTVPGTMFPSGIDYLKQLGITHLHLLPFQDINPAHSDVYNWGYETTLFNVPEEQYSTHPNDPLNRISEVKRMVQGLQQAGIAMVMDVVYNHSVPAEGPGSAFWQAVPYYYFRTNDRGDVLNESGVGNALNDSQPMVRKFIRDSLVYWAKEYRIDGFRFDLIGMFTPESNRDFARAIRSVNPWAIVYGEPWTGGGPLRFGKGDQRGTGVAVFNDNFRGVFRGGLDSAEPGFAMGAGLNASAVQKALMGSVDDFANSPSESVNYVSAHDNMSLWDKVALALPDRTNGERAAAVKLSLAATLLSQGIPFIEGGVEIGRTKGMNPNSYNAGDSVNQFDWSTAPKHADVMEYLRGLIELRKKHPMFRLSTAEQSRKLMSFFETHHSQVIGARIRGEGTGDSWKEVLIVLNGSVDGATIDLPEGEWTQVVDGQRAGIRTIGATSGHLKMDGLSAAVLYRG